MRLGQSQGFGIVVYAMDRVTLLCQPAHVPACAASHVEYGAVGRDQMGPALQPSRGFFGAVHGVWCLKLKTGPQLFGQHDDHIGLAVEPKAQTQSQCPKPEEGVALAHAGKGALRAMGLSRTGRFTKAAKTPRAIAKYQTML